MTPKRGSHDEVLSLKVAALEQALRESVQSLERATAQRARLLRHVLRAETQERARIAAGIHEDAIQVMSSASMALDLLLSKWDAGPSLEVTHRARALVGDSIRRLRKLVFDLKPVELEEEGLATALIL